LYQQPVSSFWEHLALNNIMPLPTSASWSWVIPDNPETQLITSQQLLLTVHTDCL